MKNAYSDPCGISGRGAIPPDHLVHHTSARRTVRVWLLGIAVLAGVGCSEALPEPRKESFLSVAAWQVSFTPDGQRLLTGSRTNMGRVKAWDPRTGQELSDLSGPEIVYPVLPSGFSRQKLNLGSFVLSHQGKLAASFDNNNPLWDKPLETRRFQGALLLLWDTATGEVVHSLPGGFTGRAAFSPDGTLVAVPAWKGFVEVIVQIVDVETGKVLTRPQIPSPAPLDILALAFSPDGTRLACANFLPEGPGAVSVWDLASGQRVWESQLDNGLRTIAYSPNGSLLAAAGTDGIIHIWDAADGQHGYTLLGHEGVIHKLAFHPNSRYLASAGTDGTARIWDLRTKKAIHTLRHSRGVTDIAFSPDAKWLATSLESGDGGVVVWNLQPAKETK